MRFFLCLLVPVAALKRIKLEESNADINDAFMNADENSGACANNTMPWSVYTNGCGIADLVGHLCIEGPGFPGPEMLLTDSSVTKCYKATGLTLSGAHTIAEMQAAGEPFASYISNPATPSYGSFYIECPQSSNQPLKWSFFTTDDCNAVDNTAPAAVFNGGYKTCDTEPGNQYPTITSDGTNSQPTDTWYLTNPPGGNGFNLPACANFPDPAAEPSAKNDPLATNMAGQHFEILQLGTFQFLSVTKDSLSSPMLSLHATIQRAGQICGATYIKNLTLTGSWLNEADGTDHVSVRAAESSEIAHRQQALQVAFDEQWQRASTRLPKVSKLVKKASKESVLFDVHGVMLDIGIDAHRIRDGKNKKTDKWAFFLNLDVKGMRKLEASSSDLQMSGLLAYDDHHFATVTPDGCDAKKEKQSMLKVNPQPISTKMNKKADLSSTDLEESLDGDDESEEPSFLSSLKCQ